MPVVKTDDDQRAGGAVLLARRRVLSVGGLAVLGLGLPRLLRAEGNAKPRAEANTATGAGIRPRAKACILFFMEGGPSHIDLWDMKPDAPAHVRGPFRPIQTTLSGFHVCEHLPQWARIMHHMTTIRSVSHSIVDHNASSHYMLTGEYPIRDSQLIRGPSRENAPPYGSVLAKLRPSGKPLPDYVHLPKQMFNCGNFIPGLLAGFLGDAYDPLIAGDPSVPNYEVPGLELRLPESQLDSRRLLLSDIDRGLGRLSDSRALERKDVFYEKAFSLITSPQARRAFNLDEEPESVRQRYGFGVRAPDVRGGGLQHLGQCLLLARRLVEAGVRLVSVWAGGQAFDGHRDHFNSLVKGLCPPTDQAVSALIEDLADRRLLDATLFVAMGEFGRTPKVGQITSSAGATPDGRDHWPNCYTVFLAGGGMKAGYVLGASDRFAAYPTEKPLRPEDIAATIYTALGIEPRTQIYDRLNRPHPICRGEPIRDVFA
jgi:hypothetical protein